jgi:hypothetical protein
VDNMLAVEGDVRGNDTIQPLMTHAGLGPHMTNAARFLPHCVRKLKNERLKFLIPCRWRSRNLKRQQTDRIRVNCFCVIEFRLTRLTKEA